MQYTHRRTSLRLWAGPIWIVLLTCLTLSTAPVLGSEITLRVVSLTDDGDQDGYLDTNESGTLVLEATNRSDESVDSWLQVSSDSSELLCKSREFWRLQLLPGESRLLAPLHFTVRDGDRTSLGLNVADPLRIDLRLKTFASCSTGLVPTTTDLDSDVPAVGQTFFYLVRVAAPSPGSWGADSSGTERSVGCP